MVFFMVFLNKNFTLNLSFIKGSEDTKQDLIVMFLCLMFPRTFNVVTIIHRIMIDIEIMINSLKIDFSLDVEVY